MCTTNAVGIDLGTTYSAVAVFRNGKSEVIKCMGHGTTQSVVFFDKEDSYVSVGDDALDNAPKCPKNEIFDVKRIIGRKYRDEFVQKLINSANYPFSIVEGENGDACIEIMKDTPQVKRPEEVSKELLEFFRVQATDFLGQEVTQAVISVPAYFSHGQREATKRAAQMAGLEVLRLISEPVAAAIHYTFRNDMDTSQSSLIIMVFDFGGGTLDVSIMKVEGQTYEVKAVHGDPILGGNDIDDILVNHFKNTIKTDNDVLILNRLRKNCRKLKRKVAEMKDVKRSVTKSFTDKSGKDIILELTREEYDKLNKDIFVKALDVVKVCLRKAGLNKKDIDQIVMAGGSSKNLKVYEMLKGYFNINPKRDMDADEAIALGASLEAAILKKYDRSLENYKIVEVTPLTLGINTSIDAMWEVIPKNTPLPHSKSEKLVTRLNDQSDMAIKIYEGERKQVRYNNLLGEFILKGLPRGKAGSVEVEANFDLDEDGILKVTAKELSTGRSEELIMTIGNYYLCEYQVDSSLQAAADHEDEDQLFVKFDKKFRSYSVACNGILYEVENIENDFDRVSIRKICTSFTYGIRDMTYHNITKFDNICVEFLNAIRPFRLKYVIISKNLTDFPGF